MNQSPTHSWLIGAALIAASVAAGCAPKGNAGAGDADSSSLEERLEQPKRAAPERQWFVEPLGAADDGLLNAPGYAVALSGTTAVFTAPRGPAVYVFGLMNDGWRQQAKLEPPLDIAGRVFGGSVALSGDTLVVGALPVNSAGTILGAAYVYRRSGTTWSVPVSLGADDGRPEHAFGQSVAVLGDTIVVGAPFARHGDEDEGAAYVFTRSGSTWPQTAKLLADSDNGGNSRFGDSVAISATTLLVGAPLAPAGTFQGRAYFFTRSGAAWSQPQMVGPRVPYCCDEFGHSVALGENTAVIGAPSHRGRFAGTPSMDGYRQGAAFVFTKSTSGWTRDTELLADDGVDFDAFGTSVAVSGSTVMVGAPGAGGALLGGADTVYVFDWLLGSTVQHRIGSRGQVPFFGGGLALDGDVGVVGTLSGQNGAYAVEFLATDGGACDSDLDCGARHCVDGVCCNVPCSGACETCATGTCTALPQYPAPSCAPFLCTEAGGVCPMQCTANSNCVNTHYCLRRNCVERLPNGERCTEARACVSGRCIDNECAGRRGLGTRCSSAADCESGFCVDGYCCDQSCRGQCEACDRRGARGICSVVPAGGVPHGDRAACAGTDTVCGGECDGEHTVGCGYPRSDRPCGTSCTDGEQTNSACNGQGECEAGEPFSCNNLDCADDLVCKESCADIDDCVRGFTCEKGGCVSHPTCLDENTLQGTDGTERDCEPYVCHQGRCLERCDKPSDCTDGNTCDRENECVTAPRTAAATRNEGGCSIARPRASHALWVLWGLAGVAALAARRASRTRRARFSS